RRDSLPSAARYANRNRSRPATADAITVSVSGAILAPSPLVSGVVAAWSVVTRCRSRAGSTCSSFASARTDASSTPAPACPAPAPDPAREGAAPPAAGRRRRPPLPAARRVPAVGPLAGLHGIPQPPQPVDVAPHGAPRDPEPVGELTAGPFAGRL